MSILKSATFSKLSMSMATFCPSNDSFSAATMSQLVKPRLHFGPRRFASISATAEKEKKIIVMRSRGSENFLSFHNLLEQAQPEFRETLSLHFSDKKGRHICCGECRGLLHFEVDGNIILCNPTTGQFSIFPRPRPLPRKGSRRVRDDVTIFEPSGFGYDHTSDDYKLVRIFWHSYFDNEKKERAHGFYRKTVARVYAFKSKSWKVIEVPREAQMGGLDNESCAYICGKYYWLHGLPSSDRILSFDFATDTLEISPLPKSDDIIHCFYQFGELDGKLGAILHERPDASRASTRVEVWVCEKDGSWVRRFGAALDNVVRSLGLKHGLLFLEGKRSSEKLSQLLVCDLATEKLEWLEIYDNFETMEIFTYSESTYSLPDGSTCPFDDVDVDDDDDDDEIEDTSDEETDDDDDWEEAEDCP